NLTNYHTNICIDLHGATATNGTLGGSVVANLGRGNASNVAGINVVSIFGGTVGGSVIVIAGSGNESLNIGKTDSAVFGAPTTLTVGGDLRVTDSHGSGLGNVLQI